MPGCLGEIAESLVFIDRAFSILNWPAVLARQPYGESQRRIGRTDPVRFEPPPQVLIECRHRLNRQRNPARSQAASHPIREPLAWSWGP